MRIYTPCAYRWRGGGKGCRDGRGDERLRPGGVDGDGCAARQVLGELPVLGHETARAVRRGERDDAEAAAADLERHGHGRVQPQGRGDSSQLRVATALGLQSTMAVPLQIGGRRLGVISLGTTSSGRRFVPQDREFAADLARRAAIAIDAARP